MGIDGNRFVGLEEWLAKELSCGICKDILDNAVDTKCGHTFCRTCITSIVAIDYRLICPECRHEFTSITGGPVDWQLKPSYRISSVISKLKIRCDLFGKGCREVIEYGLLSAHLKTCAFRLCPKCDLVVGNREDHDCIALLKNVIKELKKQKRCVGKCGRK